jgi:hypothetical protein
MKSVLILGALAALSAAAPTPQEIDLDGVAAILVPNVGPPVNAVSQPDAYDAAAATSSAAASITTVTAKVKRGVNDPCAPQPGTPSPNVNKTREN